MSANSFVYAVPGALLAGEGTSDGSRSAAEHVTNMGGGLAETLPNAPESQAAAAEGPASETAGQLGNQAAATSGWEELD